MQKKKFYDFKNDLEKGKKVFYDDDDVPELVEQGGSSDESGSERSDSESMPDLVSDGLDSFSDDASESEFIETTQKSLIGIRKKRSLRLSQRLREKKKIEKPEKKMKTIEIKLKLNRKKPAEAPSFSVTPVNMAEMQELVTKPKLEPIPKPDVIPEPDPTPKLSNAELKRELALGSKYHLEKKEHEAFMQYQKAVKLIHDCPVKYGGMNELEYVSFTYCFGHICLTSIKLQEIQKSEQLFGGILKDHADIYFPLAYYGLGCYFQKINRFTEAVEQLKKGEKCLNESPEPQPVIFWPETTQPVKESVSDCILESFEELIHDCKNPPKPLAVCHFQNCTYSKRDIYLTDIDFKGYVHILCTEDCRLDYHIGCWKHCRVDFYDRTHEKDILNKACCTPDCLGTIFTIATYGNDGKVRSEAKVDANSKPKHLQKSAHQPQPAMSKSKKKRQKKKLKKHSEEEEAAATGTEVTNDNSESQTKSKESKPKKEAHTTSVIEETLDEEDVGGGEELKKEQKQEIFEKQEDYQFVLKKDDINENQQTNLKTVKKKKQKLKKGLADFEFKFSGDEERRFLRHEDADENGYIDFSKFLMPSVVEDESSVSSDSGSGDAQALLLENVENINETVYMIYSYFHAVLEKEGPLPISSRILLDDFKSFPPEAHIIVKATGGLAQFLLKSLKFAMFEDHICLLKHAVRCKEILARKHGDVVDTDFDPVGAPYHQSPERTVRDFQPLLTPFDIQDLNVHGSKPTLIHHMNKYIKSQETVDGVDEIKINDLESDEEKLSDESDAESSETDENEELDEDDSSVSQEDNPEKDEKEYLNPESGYQVGKIDIGGITDPRKESLVVDFEGDEEYIDDEILGKELELEGSYDIDPNVNDHLATDMQSIPDNGDALNIESSVPNPVQQAPVYSSNKGDERNDSGIGTVSPNDMEPVNQSSNSKDDEIDGKFTSDSSSILPPEILEGFCLNKPTPFGPIIKSESYESYSISNSNGSEENSDIVDDKNVEGEKIWHQGFDLVTALEADLDWFTLEKTSIFDPEEIDDVIQIPEYVWKMTLSSIIKLKDHCTAIQKKISHMKTKYVQCTPKSKNIGLNTTPYEPYKQEYLEMVAKNDNLQEILKDTMTKYTYLKQSGVAETSSLREELKTMKLENEELSKKLNEKLALVEQNKKKWHTERSLYISEGKTKDDKLQTLDEDILKMTTEMSKKDHKLNQMSQHILKERENFKAEKNKLKEMIEINSQSSQALKNRAEESEVKLLQSICTNQCKTLMDVIKEAETNRDKLVNSDQGDTMDAMKTWQETVGVNTKKVREVKSIYDGLIQKVKSGTPLDKLLPIEDVLPFWPPPQSVRPSKKAVSADVDADQAGNPKGQLKTPATATVASSNAASQKNTWLSAQQNEARRREASYMASNSHKKNTTQKLYEGYQDNSQWQQQHLQQQQYQQHQHQNLTHASQNNLTTHMAGQFTQSQPAQVYSNPLGRGGGNLHAMAQGGPPDVLHSGISHPSHTAASYSVPQKAATPTSSTTLENKKNPTAAFASAAKPFVVPEKSQASVQQQTHSLGAMAGNKVSGRYVGPIPAAPPHLKKSFDKLIYQLGVIFDNRYTKGQLAMFLNKVREANGGSLSGLPAKDIIDRVVKLVLKREEDHPVNQPAKQAYPKKLPPGISTAREPGTWKTMPIKQTKILNLEEEDPCVICHEEMPMKPVSKLECQHVFHTDCIQRWMNEQKTCPTCREFVLLPDDYPSL
ncbi:uncharacterized protein LOC117114928 [Anneissia japonica]|uniref:uncharacterized protein LOC117114928 n=1 Tax=Anneissia japonica TaxID=1529436 RepID=UPI001425B3F0|nr:uncharacterized protein LOC117114928 [Anneissia japonica]